MILFLFHSMFHNHRSINTFKNHHFSGQLWTRAAARESRWGTFLFAVMDSNVEDRN